MDYMVPTPCHSTALECLTDTSTKWAFSQVWEILSWIPERYFPHYCFVVVVVLSSVIIVDISEPLKQEQDTAVPAGGEAWANATELHRAGGNSEDHLVHAHTPRQDHPYPCFLFLTDSSNLFIKPSSDRDLTVSSGSLCHGCSPIHPGQKRWLFPSALQQCFSTWRPLCCLPSAIFSG